jgi:opacity protein-like surface antigen
MRDQDISQNLPAGWVASVAGNITSWLGLVGEVGGHRKTLSIPGDPPTLSVFTFMGGPRFTARAVRPVTPFAQVLFGSARARSTVLDVGDTVTDFAYQPGGGVDVTLTRNVAIRLEGDYRIIRADGSNSKESRFVSAAVIGFGR